MTTKVKICGINTAEALEVALEAGADFVGFVFYPKSPRNISLAHAAELVEKARAAGSVQTVALVVDPADAQIDEILRRAGPDIIQLHGHETAERVRQVAKLAGRPVWKALSVSAPEDVAAAPAYLAKPPGAGASMILFDAKAPADPKLMPGGNGLTFDWRILESVNGRYPFALAGGLTPDNVAAAIRLTKAAIVDVSSGVESAPGVKDPGLIRRFLREAKAAKQTT